MNLSELPDHSRVWIYQADRFLTNGEVVQAQEQLDAFVAEWAAHGAKLKAAAEVINSLFIVIGVDEQQAAASGCSIDASMSVVKTLEEAFQLSFTNRMLVAADVNDGSIGLFALNSLDEAKTTGDISEETLVYDNLVTTIGDWKTSWKKPIKESWHARFV